MDDQISVLLGYKRIIRENKRKIKFILAIRRKEKKKEKNIVFLNLIIEIYTTFVSRFEFWTSSFT